MLKTCTPVGQMGLTKRELCKELNEAFENIYGDWENTQVIELSDFKITKESVDEVLKYTKEWLEMVNRHNEVYECRIGSICRVNGDDNTNYFRLTCSWCEIDKSYVECTYDDDSDTELLSYK
jgi:hypothetical protein